MKIGFYIHHSTIKAGGIFTYSIGILKLLLASEKIEKIYLIYSPEIRNDLSEIIKNKKVELIEINRNAFYIKFPFMISYFLFDSYLLIKNYLPNSKSFSFLKKISFFINPYKFILSKINFDVLHIPLQYSPIYNLNKPIIITMHDLQEFHFPEFFSSQERLHRSINNKKAIEESSHIIVSFDHIKTDLIKYFQIDGEKISVCPPPFQINWFAKSENTELVDVKNKYNLLNDFILYPAATWQHKNHINLLHALHILKQQNISIKLVCTGNKTEYFNDVIGKKIIEFNLSNEVKFLGIVPESDLISLYKNTTLVVIPTLYEAGSGPLYEAMRYNTPVICARTTSLPETMSNDEFMFNPKDPENIAELIQKGINDSEFRRRNIENSKLRMEYFKNLDSGKFFIYVYKLLMERANK